MRGRPGLAEKLLEEIDVNDDECPNGDELCNGEEDLRAGKLPCFECFLEAPEDLIDEFNDQRVDQRENRPTVERGEVVDA